MAGKTVGTLGNGVEACAVPRSEPSMTKYQRASQIWSLLICAARERKTYTYEEVAAILDMESAARVIGHFLDPIMQYCAKNDLPPLTVLVVKKATRRPGSGLSTVDDVDQDRDRVFRHKWFTLVPPQCSDFEAVHRQ